jgi:hypothetical protein
VIHCEACHNPATLAMTSVSFPSGADVSANTPPTGPAE